MEKIFASLLRDSLYAGHRVTAFRSPNVPYFGGGCGTGWPRLWSTLWGTLTLHLFGHWSCHGLMASKPLMGGWLCSWRTYGAMPCMPNQRGPLPVLCRRYLYQSVWGLLYLLLVWMWLRLIRRWAMVGVILILRPFRLRRPGGKCAASAGGAPAAPVAPNIRVRLCSVHTRISTSDQGWRTVGEACQDIYPSPGSQYGRWS